MESSYGQFCTVARGAEVLCERWTPLVIRELLCGSKRFNDLRRGVPRMSTSLLAQRLQRLEQFGIVRRTAAGKVWEYSLTAAGEELRPIVMALGHWGARWIGSRLRDDELDAGLLMWDIRRFVRLALQADARYTDDTKKLDLLPTPQGALEFDVASPEDAAAYRAPNTAARSAAASASRTSW